MFFKPSGVDTVNANAYYHGDTTTRRCTALWLYGNLRGTTKKTMP
jgi:hypothetical protein